MCDIKYIIHIIILDFEKSRSASINNKNDAKANNLTFWLKARKRKTVNV